MGYFSNGTEGEMFREAWCYRCVNWRDLDDGRGAGCPVMDAHFAYAYEMCNKKDNPAKIILDALIRPVERVASDGLPVNANECSMFLLTNDPLPGFEDV